MTREIQEHSAALIAAHRAYFEAHERTCALGLVNTSGLSSAERIALDLDYRAAVNRSAALRTAYDAALDAELKAQSVSA